MQPRWPLVGALHPGLLLPPRAKVSILSLSSPSSPLVGLGRDAGVCNETHVGSRTSCLPQAASCCTSSSIWVTEAAPQKEALTCLGGPE